MTVRLAPDAAPIALGEKSRRLLGRLLVEPGAVVSIDALADALWGDEVRADRRNGVQVAVKALRKLLGDDDEPVADNRQRRRRLSDRRARPLLIDAERFKLLARRGTELVTLPQAARAMFAEALSVWSGPLLGEHADRNRGSPAMPASSPASATRSSSSSTRCDSTLGEHARLDATLRRQIVEHPLRRAAPRAARPRARRGRSGSRGGTRLPRGDPRSRRARPGNAARSATGSAAGMPADSQPGRSARPAGAAGGRRAAVRDGQHRGRGDATSAGSAR